MSDVPEFEVVVERNNRRSTAPSIADTPEKALLDVLKTYTSIDTHSVGAVEIRHNPSYYTVLGLVEGRDEEDAELSINEVEQKGVLKSGGMVVTVQR